MKTTLWIVGGVVLLFAAGWALSGPLNNLFSGSSESVPQSSQTSAESQTKPSENPSSTDVQSSVPIQSVPPESSPSQPEKPDEIKAICPGDEVLHNDDALSDFCEKAAENGVNTIIIDVKNTAGYILYSQIGYDYAAGAAHDVYASVAEKGAKNAAFALRDNLNNVVNIIKQYNLTAVARINCFCDSYGGNALTGAKATLSGGTTWLDNSKENGGKSWLNPYSDAAQAYNKAILDDCVTFGFDAVILDFVQFPVGFSTDRIDYGAPGEAATKKECLEDFIESMTNTTVPVYLTVRNTSPEGSAEFGGSPFDYRSGLGIAGYVVIVNAPEKARTQTPEQPTGEIPQASCPTQLAVITALLSREYDTARFAQLEQFAQLAY